MFRFCRRFVDACNQSRPTSAWLRLVGALVFIQFFVSDVTGQRYGTAPWPFFSPTPQNVTYRIGERAVMKCRVENLGTRTITWRRQGQTHPLTIGEFTFAPDARLSVDRDQRTDEWSLIIDDVQLDDEGAYLCQITVKTDPNRYSYKIRLNVKTVRLTGTEYVELGRPIRLLCNASGRREQPYHVAWYFDGRPVDSDVTSGLFITTKFETRSVHSTIVISKSGARHQGLYECRTSGGETDSMTVHVLNDFLINQRKGYKGIFADRIISDDGSGRKMPIRASTAVPDSVLSTWLQLSLLLSASYRLILF